MDAHVRFKKTEKEAKAAIEKLAREQIRSVPQMMKALVIEALRHRKLIRS